jgi:hypothetical protein
MPSGQSNTSTSTTSVQAPQATNPALSSLFTSLFGGLGTQSAQTAGNIQSGQQLTNNIGQLYSSLQQNSQGAYQQGIASIKAAAGASGNALGTSTSAQIGNYAGNYIQGLNTTATNMGLSELNTQSASSGGILSLLASAGSSYYSPGSTTAGSSQTTQTGAGAWLDPVLGLAGAGLGAAGAAGSFGALFA